MNKDQVKRLIMIANSLDEKGFSKEASDLDKIAEWEYEGKFDFGIGYVPAHHHANGGGWVADTAKVAETAYVGPNARVYDKAQVLDNAKVFDFARVFDHAQVFGSAWVFGNAQVFDNVDVSGFARVSGNEMISGFDVIVRDDRDKYANEELGGN